MGKRDMVVKAYVDAALYQSAHWQAHEARMTLSDFIALSLREALERRGVKATSLMDVLEGQRELQMGGVK
jgi:hypothetical protein